MFGDGVVAQVVLSNNEKGDYQSISWGWGLGVMLGVYVSGISGAHLVSDPRATTPLLLWSSRKDI